MPGLLGALSPMEAIMFLTSGAQDISNFIRGGQYSREQEGITRDVVNQANQQANESQQSRMDLAQNMYGNTDVNGRPTEWASERDRYINDAEANIQNYRNATSGDNSMRGTADRDSQTYRANIDQNYQNAAMVGRDYQSQYLAQVNPYYQAAGASADAAQGAAEADRANFTAEYEKSKADTLAEREKITGEYASTVKNIEFSSAKDVASQTAGIWAQAGAAMGNLMAQSGTMDPAQFARAQQDLMKNFTQQANDTRAKASEAALNATATAKANAYSAWSATAANLTNAADNLYGAWTGAMGEAGKRLVDVANTRTALAANYGNEVEKASAVLKAAGLDYSQSLANWASQTYEGGLAATAADHANEAALTEQLTALNKDRWAMETTRLNSYTNMVMQAYDSGDSWRNFAMQSRLGYRKQFNDLNLSNLYGTMGTVYQQNAVDDANATAARQAQQNMWAQTGVSLASPWDYYLARGALSPKPPTGGATT